MSATPRPSQKKQATLTSFFTPRSASVSASTGTGGPPSSSPAASQGASQGSLGAGRGASQRPVVLPSRKRPLEEEADLNRPRTGKGGKGRKGGKSGKGGRGGTSQNSHGAEDADNADNADDADGTDDADDEPKASSGRSRFARAVKRARASAGSDSDEENEENENGASGVPSGSEGRDGKDGDYEPMETEELPQRPGAEASLPRSSGRTERYVYDARRSHASQEQTGAGDGDDVGAGGLLDGREGNGSDSDDPATKRRKAELHRRFVKKLGHPDSLPQRRRNFVYADAAGTGTRTGEGEAEGDEAEGDEGGEDEERPAAKKGGKKGGSGTKLTPLEQQFLAIKRAHMDTVLVVEVGYKFRFLGEDARTAARVLGIVCIPGKVRYDEHASEAHLERFASASIPVPRLGVHVRRLVAAGLKVGVVRQMETAALKKAGDNRNAPFVRRLTSVYTKGTFIDDLGEDGGSGGSDGSGSDGSGDGTSTSARSSGYLLCLTETPAAGSGAGADERVQIGLLAVQPATGDIVYDSFEDGFLRNELETRLLHIAPCELLLVGGLSRATDKVVQHLAGSATNVFGDRTRVERVERAAMPMATADAQTHVTQFYAEQMGDADENDEDSKNDEDDKNNKNNKNDKTANAPLARVLRLPPPVLVCLSAMITHLAEYGLQHLLALTAYFAAFTSRRHMLLSGTTLESLEVYRNATDHGLRGSLLWALDKTRTRFGHRLLRRWIGRPLLDRVALAARVTAVDELRTAAATPRRDKLEQLLATASRTDLERSLLRIYYGKCSRPELVAVLQTLQRIGAAYASEAAEAAVAVAASTADSPDPPFAGFTSPLLARALAALPAIHDAVVAYLDTINADAARRDDKYTFFREAAETDDIAAHKVGIAAVELELDEQRAAIATTLGRSPSRPPPPYVTVASIEYLVEVPPSDLRRVPASWIKISGTKKVSRFHTPAVVRLLAERDQHKEALAAACDAAFAALLTSIADASYRPLRDAVAALASLDALLSLARVAALPGYCKPVLLPADAPPTLDIRAGRHPVAEHTLPSGYIPFSVRLGGRLEDRVGCSERSEVPENEYPDDDIPPRALLITGPNMGGKSSFVRAVALLTLLAQVGSFVPADAMTLTLADAVFTRMGARDNLFAGESTFMVEVSETAAILRAATPRSLVVLDELGRGTSTHDGAAIAQAVLEHLACSTRCLTLFITHYQSLGRAADALPTRVVQNVHMRFTATPTARDQPPDDDHDHRAHDDAHQDITFLYEVGRGMAHRSYGLNVARLARLPQRLIDVAARKSREMEDDMRQRRLHAALSLTRNVLRPDVAPDADQIDCLMSSIEQL